MKSTNHISNSKKASTLTNWVFIVLVVSLFLVLFQTQILDPMNTTYNQSNSIGLSYDANSTISDITTTASSSDSDIQDAEISTLSDGITILQIGSIAKRTFTTLWNFASGRFLYVLLVEQLDLPVVVATVLTVMIWMSLIFIIVRIFMRGVTP